MFDKFNTFDKCKKIWNYHGFLILFIFSIVLILFMSLLKKGIKVEKSIPMKYNDWEKTTKEFHKNGIDNILGTNLN